MSSARSARRHTAPVNLKQLATRDVVTSFTAHRILSVMVESRLVDRIEPGTYRLGIRLLELGNLVKSRISVRQEALPQCRSCTGARRNGEPERAPERRSRVHRAHRARKFDDARRADHRRARPAPHHRRGQSFSGARQRSNLGGLREANGPAAIDGEHADGLAGAREELERIRNQGYAFDNEEAEKGVSCIGAGIYNDEGRVVAGLSVSAPSDRLNKDWAHNVRQAADRISRAIGFRRQHS